MLNYQEIVKKCMSDVQCQYEKELQFLYLIAKKEPAAAYDLFIPLLTTDELNLECLKHYRNVVTLPDGRKPESMVLAICDPSSTMLMYRMTPDLKEIGQKLPSKGKLLRLKADSGCDKGTTKERK
uniref:tRNA-splicing endonuclease subunit Sen15 domain-containing protein n=1 Tax=Anopheles culicifacies TaxID=139723 RepID=A0A182LV27_9DIPT